MRFHQDALKAAADAIHNDRFLMHKISDEALAERCIEAYTEAKPDRRRKTGFEPPVDMPRPAPPGVLPTEGRDAD